ncbi:MAG TPA: fibronectin type III domain-containing protein [Candidatus Angelobacter sp.]|nr:fibronectin type III domain-containing protein [Candidatus Angelobacter sp.]
MKPIFPILIMIVAISTWMAAQTPLLKEEPALPSVSVEITQGPVVESVTDTTAVIAWSTNVNAGTVLHYGTDPNRLQQTAGMPWGGLTHRVNLKDLKPDTKYYFQAESPKGQGTGTSATAPPSSFRTKVAVACTGRCT